MAKRRRVPPYAAPDVPPSAVGVRVAVVHDTDPRAPNGITTYLHCGKCLDEWKAGAAPGQSPAEYSRTQAGMWPDGSLQVWCNRHQCNVDIWHVRALREADVAALRRRVSGGRARRRA